MTKNKTSSYNLYVLYAVIIMTLFSQLPIIIDTSYSGVMQGVWLLTIPMFLPGFNIIFTNSSYVFFSILLIFILWLCSVFYFTNSNIFLLKYHLLSFYFICVGSGFGIKISMDKLFKVIYQVSFIFLPVVCSILYFSIFKDYDVTSRIYGYANKNSIGIIIVTSFIFILFNRGNGYYNKILKIAFLVMVAIVLFLLKSRAALLCFLLIVPSVLFLKVINNKDKIYFAVGFLILFFLLIIFYQDKIQFLLDNFIFAGRDITDSNDLSSGRLNQMDNFWLVKDHFIFGLQSDAPLIDVFYLYFPIVYGIPIFILTLIYLFFPIQLFLRIKKYNHPLLLCFISIIFSYYIDGLFEGLAPLGPGVRSFLLWFLSGFILSRITKRDSRIISK